MGGSWNAALTVTAVRICLIPGVMVLILWSGMPGDRWVAAALYLLAASTDSLDGWLARSRGQVTVAGAFLDPLADKLLVSGALLALIQTDEVSAWATMIIITREFAVTGLRLVAVSEDLIIPASRFGKLKTLSQNAAIAWIISPLGLDPVGDILLGIALVMTVLSGAYYFIMAQRRLFAKKPPQREVAGDP
ncbi:MAG: CDP-diacylglycerol--glycerol-3-phosphate 3-phosphatidyltransferase [Thermoleophilia bacterium]|nr:CDP-diacylglycerol--glycerol-3-phosphate 3-phosphatidyltransferase [Thermoleophilia bacterium]